MCNQFNAVQRHKLLPLQVWFLLQLCVAFLFFYSFRCSCSVRSFIACYFVRIFGVYISIWIEKPAAAVAATGCCCSMAYAHTTMLSFTAQHKTICIARCVTHRLAPGLFNWN